MKTEITDTGWKEITTTEIKIIGQRWSSLQFDNMPTQAWVGSNERLGLTKNRSTCNCCHRSWRGMAGKVNFFTTNKGNKAICDECVIKIFVGRKDGS